jgi:hypothetical protein
MMRRSRKHREVANRLDQLIDLLKQQEATQMAAQESQARRDEYNVRVDRRRQFSLSAWTASFSLYALAFVVKGSDPRERNALYYLVLIGGFIMYCVSAIGLMRAERSVKRRLAKELKRSELPRLR